MPNPTPFTPEQEARIREIIAEMIGRWAAGVNRRLAGMASAAWVANRTALTGAESTSDFINHSAGLRCDAAHCREDLQGVAAVGAAGPGPAFASMARVADRSMLAGGRTTETVLTDSIIAAHPYSDECPNYSERGGFLPSHASGDSQ